MVPQKDSKTISDNIRKYLDPMSKRHLNVVNLNSGSTLEHELKKAEICYCLLQHGHTFLTEPKLKNGKRPDILVLDLGDPIAYEIMKSESDDSIELKREAYLGIEIVPVRI